MTIIILGPFTEKAFPSNIFQLQSHSTIVNTKGRVSRQVLSLIPFNLVRFKNMAHMHKILKQNSKTRHNGQKSGGV